MLFYRNSIDSTLHSGNSHEYDHIINLDIRETVDESVPSSESESSDDCFGDLDGSLPDQENDSLNDPIDLSSEELLHVNDGEIDVEKELSYLAINHGLYMKGLET